MKRTKRTTKATKAKPFPLKDETFPARDRAYLCCELAPEGLSLGIFGRAEVFTCIADEGHKHGYIADKFNIWLPGADDLSMWIDRCGTTDDPDDVKYRLWECTSDGGTVLLAEADTIQEVTKRWHWVLDKTVQDAVFAARYPELADEYSKAA